MTRRTRALGCSLLLVALLLVAACAPEEDEQPGDAPTATATPTSPPEDIEAASHLPECPARDRAQLPALPQDWPVSLELGMANPPDGAAEMVETADFGFRYQYLSGGVNTGRGWAEWQPDGAFVPGYIAESEALGLRTVFSYYMLLHSAPSGHSEEDAVLATLRDEQVMRAYYADLALFFERAGEATDEPVVLHLEPDLWGYVQRASNTLEREVTVLVGSSGVEGFEDLPDNIAGFGEAIVRMRDELAPNVLLGYHASLWGGGVDPIYNEVPPERLEDLADRAARYYCAVAPEFDIIFTEFTDRDAGFKEVVYGDGGASWWTAEDFVWHAAWVDDVVRTTGRRVVMWQIPYGNTVMRAVNNTWNHFQDNKVEWLLHDPTRENIDSYRRAGVVAFLFGRGADGATDASDASGDGVTDFEPINGNDRASYSADDDGGFFRRQAAEYYERGALELP